MRIAHISDLHLSHAFDKKLTGRVYKFLKHVSQRADHLVITGDISDNAEEEDFILFREMLSRLGLLDGNKTSVVIGNHDIFGGVIKAEDILNFPQRCRETDYQQKVELFHSYLGELQTNCVYQGTKNGYPYAKLIEDSLVIGVNSIAEYSSLRNPFASNGEISDEQLIEIQTIFHEYSKYCKTKIILVHHHFNKMRYMTGSFTERIWMNIEKQTMKLRKKKKILEFFKQNGVNLILHGHFHQMHAYTRKSIEIANAGASIRNSGGQFQYNLIDAENGSVSISHKTKLIEIKKPQLLHIIAPAENLPGKIAIA
ncbi:MAG: metallophosphoesterase [Ignavibacteriaceae bacterium]|nr:metallophosphoesterase [Ignavibacteriaceae bacterium]